MRVSSCCRPGWSSKHGAATIYRRFAGLATRGTRATGGVRPDGRDAGRSGRDGARRRRSHRRRAQRHGAARQRPQLGVCRAGARRPARAAGPPRKRPDDLGRGPPRSAAGHPRHRRRQCRGRRPDCRPAVRGGHGWQRHRDTRVRPAGAETRAGGQRQSEQCAVRSRQRPGAVDQRPPRGRVTGVSAGPGLRLRARQPGPAGRQAGCAGVAGAGADRAADAG
ncbi:hypothetical protein LMG3412_05292 [Achromobacter deleyi]|nr:hypothetical protein LMG3412_05292 [Achromobacter deleyi]